MFKLFKDNIHHTKRVTKVSRNLDIDEDIIEETLDIMYDYIRMKLMAVEVKDENTIMTKEEFDKTFPTIAIPKMGTIAPSYKKYLHVMKKIIKRNESKN